MAVVLALEPDLRQATVLKRVIKEHVGAELTVVDSRDGALAAIAERMPDVILLTALLSPRDEEELFSRLRAMAGSEHVQTHTIPQLASAATPAPEEHGGGGVFGKLRRKKAEPKPIPGCDPELFAEEVVTFLQRAAELKISGSSLRTWDGDDEPMRPAGPRPPVEVHAELAPAPAEAGSAWSSPFEWRPAAESRSAAPPAAAEPVIDPHAHEDVEGKIARAALREADMAAERIRVEAEREAERLRMEAERVVERERERARVEAEREKERLRVEAERETERLRVEAERQAEKLRVEAERQKLEAQRHKEAAEREAERHKLEADAAAARRREADRLREEAAKEKERLRKQAEQEKERLRKETEERRIAAEREAERVRLEAEREAERLRLEAERHRVEAERQKAAAEREKERLRLEAERQKAEAERRKFEAEAAATRQREAERLRQEAQREAERLRLQAEQEKKDAEQQKLKAQREAERLRQEAERQKKEAEAAAARQREAERLRREAERRKEDAEREADRLRVEALREAERLRAQAEEEAERARAEEAIAAAKTQEEARERRDAERARKRSAERARRHKDAVHDAFAEFRDDPVEHPRGTIRLVPLSVWARVEKPPAAASDTDRDELRELMKGLSIPPYVAGVSYARGCRIRRVRVPPAAPAKGHGHKRPVILSRRALDEARSGGEPRSTDQTTDR